jgi:type I restriction enzyme, S subunit
MTEVSKASAYPKSVQAGLPRLGTTPPGWSRGPLGRHLFEEMRPVKMADDEVYDLVTVKRSRGGVVLRERLKGKEIAVKSQFRLKAGDFLISKRQIVHGACGIVPPELDGAIVSNEYAVLRTRPSLDLAFLNCLAHSIYFQQTCFHSSIGVHVEKMIFKLDEWLKWNFDLPPAHEQRRIAEILSTWDRAIEAVEALIANAREQKAALMQSLLTSKRRLPGFEGGWATTSLGQLGTTFGGLSGKSATDFGTGAPFITYKNVFENAAADPRNVELVAIGGAERQNAVRFGDILFTTSSETPDEVGMSSVILFDPGTMYLNSFCFGFRPKHTDEIVPAFSAHFFRSEEMRTKIAALAQGSTRYNVSKTQMLKLSFNLPGPSEQHALAKLLDVAQALINRESDQLDALRQEKSALMQQLLTGKRRVRAAESEAA